MPTASETTPISLAKRNLSAFARLSIATLMHASKSAAVATKAWRLSSPARNLQSWTLAKRFSSISKRFVFFNDLESHTWINIKHLHNCSNCQRIFITMSMFYFRLASKYRYPKSVTVGFWASKDSDWGNWNVTLRPRSTYPASIWTATSSRSTELRKASKKQSKRSRIRWD